ncbi:conserved phage C-terminal domain-containing protein [Serratia sp. JSRIV002]|uniref:conserved phage C-terminal domain-containing protein n=1 Tax=Serratia sp. JSRIV002 TaxID=2831894 RepID=UPI001CBB7075|nr:conserved phage C-terminal domain-containing protein [Serratia sp. JSRIV002]UAN49717.1 conserved phage C-terminal domain-containing protein [Serratia sp. JSRIV002]
MSVKISSYVWDGCAAHGVKGTKLLVMLRLADFSNDEGVCYPGIAKIARQIAAGRSTVTGAIGELENDGWLTRKERRKGQRNDSNIYTLNVAKLKAAALSADSQCPDTDTSESDHSKSDTSGSERSESGKNGTFDPPESGYDPSVNSKQDPSDKNTIGQPPAAAAQDEGISEEIHITDQAILVLKHLNLLTGAKYTTAKSTLENMRARLVDGNSLDDLKLVVEYLVDRWLGTKWAKYLNPETMFKPGKFPGNLLAATAWHDGGRKPEQGRTPANNTDRDAAYRRFIGSSLPLQNPGELEQLVRTEASNTGVRGMQPSYSVNAWNRIWADCEQRIHGGKAA